MKGQERDKARLHLVSPPSRLRVVMHCLLNHNIYKHGNHTAYNRRSDPPDTGVSCTTTQLVDIITDPDQVTPSRCIDAEGRDRILRMMKSRERLGGVKKVNGT